ncbi:MAG: MFS transporter [Candidatus Tectimicrobiota bacterium]
MLSCLWPTPNVIPQSIISMHMLPALRVALARRLPFYYGWIVFAVVASTSYAARPLMAVAVLSVFMVPMTETFGWSRALVSGAVSLGGLGGVLVSPVLGRFLDKYGASALISVGSAVAGLCAIGLARVQQVWTFYALYIVGRMVFASPLELATSTSLSNWFLRRRALALALFGITQGTGLALMPLVAQACIARWGWRHAWFVLGLYTLVVGVLPSVLLMARRPEDMGLLPDPAPLRQRPLPAAAQEQAAPPRHAGPLSAAEPQFTRQQAMRTRAFWAMAVFSATGFMAQAGTSLHQVSHYIHQGMPRSTAALMASVFAVSGVPAGLLWSWLTHHLPLRYVLALAGLAVALGVAGTAFSASLASGLVTAAVFGSGVGGLHVLLRFAWAEYYGRQHLGSIQGVTLPVQLGGQAMGPFIAGALFDLTGSYRLPFLSFAGIVLVGSLLVLSAVIPRHTDASVTSTTPEALEH